MAQDRINQLSREDLAERIRTKDAVQNYLMPRSYDEKEKVYTNADLSASKVFEIRPLPTTVLTDEDVAAINDLVATSYSRVKPHTCLGFHLVLAPNVDDDIASYKSRGGCEIPVVCQNEDQVIKQFQDTMKTPLFASGFGEAPYMTRRQRCILTITVLPVDQIAGAKNSFIDYIESLLDKIRGFFANFGKKREDRPEDADRDDTFGMTPAERRYGRLKAKLVQDVNDAARRIAGTYRTQGMDCRELEPSELKALLRSQLAPRSAPSMRHDHDPLRQISDQVPVGEVIVEPSTGTIMTDGLYYKVVTMGAYPGSVDPGILTRPQQSLGWLSLLDFIGNGFISMNASAMDIDDIRQIISKKKRNLRGGMAKEGQASAAAQDVAVAEYMVETERRRFFHTQLTVCVCDDSQERAEEKAARIRDKMSDLGLECRVEQHAGPSMFFQSLILGLGPMLPESRRMFHLPDRAVADLAPFCLESRGTETAQALFRTRLGAPFRFNLFDSRTAAHMALAGESGSGKTYAALYLTLQWLREKDSQVFIFDKGKSFGPLTLAMRPHSIYKKMSQEAQTTINVCQGTLAQSGSYLLQLLNFFSSEGSDTLTGDDLGLLDRAIQGAFHEKLANEPWKEERELAERCRRRRWVAKQRKRMVIERLSQEDEDDANAIKTQEQGRDLEFEFYRQAILIERAVYEKDTDKGTEPKLVKTEDLSNPKSIPSEVRTFLVDSSGMKCESVEINGSPVTVVLYRSDDMERAMTRAHIKFQAIPNEVVLEIARRDDLKRLCETVNLKPKYPPEFITHMRAMVYQDVSTENPGSKEDWRQSEVNRRMENLHPVEYMDWLDGYAEIQDEVFLSDVMRHLDLLPAPDEGTRVRIQNLQNKLAKYHGNGSLARFFDGTTEFTLDGVPLTTFELGELSSAGPKVLGAVVGTLLQMMIIYCQQEHLKGGGPRAYRKYIVLDEFPDLLHVPLIAELVNRAQFTLRKHNAAVITIVQTIRQYHETEAGRKIFAGSQHKLIMRQTEDVINALPQWFGWDAARCAVLHSVYTAPGKFSEIFVDIANAGVREVVRLCTTPMMYWTFTTNADDVKLRRERESHYLGQEYAPARAFAMAVSDCADQFPEGVMRGRRRIQKNEAA